MGLAMIMLTHLFLLFQGSLKSWHQAVASVTGMGVSYLWLIIIFSIIPVMLQLRFLRSLPISATKLAAVMIVLIILPLIVLGMLVTGITWLASGTSDALTVLRSFTFTLAPATLFVFFVTWQGTGMVSYILMFFVMIFSQFMSFWFQESILRREAGFSLVVVIAATFVALAFLLTRRTLMRGSKAYRVQANPFGNVAWGAGR